MARVTPTREPRSASHRHTVLATMKAQQGETARTRADELERRVEHALVTVLQHGPAVRDAERAPAYQWLLDQVVRTLTGTEYDYDAWREAYAGEGQPAYAWDRGTAPWSAGRGDPGDV